MACFCPSNLFLAPGSRGQEHWFWLLDQSQLWVPVLLRWHSFICLWMIVLCIPGSLVCEACLQWAGDSAGCHWIIPVIHLLRIAWVTRWKDKFCLCKVRGFSQGTHYCTFGLPLMNKYSWKGHRMSKKKKTSFNPIFYFSAVYGCKNWQGTFLQKVMAAQIKQNCKHCGYWWGGIVSCLIWICTEKFYTFVNWAVFPCFWSENFVSLGKVLEVVLS